TPHKSQPLKRVNKVNMPSMRSMPFHKVVEGLLPTGARFGGRANVSLELVAGMPVKARLARPVTHTHMIHVLRAALKHTIPAAPRTQTTVQVTLKHTPTHIPAPPVVCRLMQAGAPVAPQPLVEVPQEHTAPIPMMTTRHTMMPAHMMTMKLPAPTTMDAVANQFRSTHYDDSRSNSWFTDERTASQSASWSERTYDDDLLAHSGYNDAQTGYDDAQSAAYDDAQGSDYHSESQISDSQNYPTSQGARSQSARSQGAHSQGSLSQGQSEGQYSEDDGTSASLSINPQEILAFKDAQPCGGSGSKVSLSPTRHSGPLCASSEATSLFSPSTHGSYLSPSGPTQAPLKLFSPNTPLQPLGKDKDHMTSLEWPGTSQSDYCSTARSDHSSFLHPSLSEQNLKLKEKDDALACHPSVTLGRCAGDLIAFFESGGQKAASNVAKSVGSVSPSKLSIGLPACTFASGSRSGSRSGSYTGSGSDVGSSSSVASPFARPCVGLGFKTLFPPSFHSTSPFRPSLPTKSAASGTGSFVSGSHRSGARSQMYGGLQTYRSDGASKAGWSETARSGASETYHSETGRSGASNTYHSETAQTGAGETYRSETPRSHTHTYQSGGSDMYWSQTPRSGGGSQTYQSDGGSRMYHSDGGSEVESEAYQSEGHESQTYHSEGSSQTYHSDRGSQTYRSGAGSQTYHSSARSQTYQSDGGSETYHSDHESDAGLSVPPSETACSAGSETARSQTYCSDGGSDTCHTETATYQAPSEA
ncbi:hypothetical protein FRC11_011104, partial [Ceratobasidium sp. 423]